MVKGPRWVRVYVPSHPDGWEVRVHVNLACVRHVDAVKLDDGRIGYSEDDVQRAIDSAVAELRCAMARIGAGEDALEGGGT